MAHARKSIRDDIKTTLTGLTTTQSNVFQSRVYPIGKAKLPGILIDDPTGIVINFKLFALAIYHHNCGSP